MSFLIDTNVISEVRKGERCDPNVAAWYASIDDSDLYLSVLILGEIRKGVELARPRDPAKAEVLQTWLESVVVAFGDRILPIDRVVGDEWGRMSAVRPVPVIDSLLAAIGIRDRPVAPRSPWQNGYIERVIGSIGRDLLNHVIVLNELHLRRLLRRYAAYYNGFRTHLGLAKDTPLGRLVQRYGEIIAVPKLGGLHHVYVRM